MMSPPSHRARNMRPSAAVDASPSHYAFPFADTPIIDTELIQLSIPGGVRHGNAEHGDRTGTGNAWWQRIPGVSRDPTPRQSPRGITGDPTPPRAELTLPESAQDQDEEPTPSPLIGAQMLTMKKENRELKTSMGVMRERIDTHYKDD